MDDATRRRIEQDALDREREQAHRYYRKKGMLRAAEHYKPDPHRSIADPEEREVVREADKEGP